jgi:hypothetical protein
MKIGKEPAHGHTNVIQSIPEFTQQFKSKIGKKNWELLELEIKLPVTIATTYVAASSQTK